MGESSISHTAYAVVNPKDWNDYDPVTKIDTARMMLVNILVNGIGQQMSTDLSILIDEDGLYHASVTWVDEIDRNKPKEDA